VETRKHLRLISSEKPHIHNGWFFVPINTRNQYYFLDY
jgi:hypothetical protein